MMVSAVFHSPPQVAAEAKAGALPKSAKPPAPALAVVPAKPAVPPASGRPPVDWGGFALKVFAPLGGIALLVAIWALLTMKSTSFPTPAATFAEALKVFSDPFYSKGPNDQGIGWNILFSLKRVAVGFGMAALVGIPLGFMIGRFEVLNRMVSPLISLLRPVSPLAWLPIGLLVFKAANPAAIWTIFICSIWP